MNLADVMDALAGRLETITGLRVYAWPLGSASPPAAIVAYPDDYSYDQTYGRGMDSMTIPVVVLAGKATERTARDELGAYVDGSGPRSVKRVLESGPYTAFDTCVVTGVDFDVYRLGGVDYVAAVFNIDVSGHGG